MTANTDGILINRRNGTAHASIEYRALCGRGPVEFIHVPLVQYGDDRWLDEVNLNRRDGLPIVVWCSHCRDDFYFPWPDGTGPHRRRKD